MVRSSCSGKLTLNCGITSSFTFTVLNRGPVDLSRGILLRLLPVCHFHARFETCSEWVASSDMDLCCSSRNYSSSGFSLTIYTYTPGTRCGETSGWTAPIQNDGVGDNRSRDWSCAHSLIVLSNWVLRDIRVSPVREEAKRRAKSE